MSLRLLPFFADRSSACGAGECGIFGGGVGATVFASASVELLSWPSCMVGTRGRERGAVAPLRCWWAY